jgi:hypothetical protein
MPQAVSEGLYRADCCRLADRGEYRYGGFVAATAVPERSEQ